MDSELKIVAPIFVLSILAGVYMPGFFQNPVASSAKTSSSLSVSELAASSPDITSFEKTTECIPGKGILRTPSNHPSPQIITSANKLIGFRLNSGQPGLWTKENSFYFRKPPNASECSSDNLDNAENEIPGINELKENKRGFKMASDGSKLCIPGEGIIWESKYHSADIISFKGKIIGIKSSRASVFLKRPPTALECTEQEYLPESKQKNISGDKIWDLYKQKDIKRNFYARTKNCEEWYAGISTLSCDYTRSGLENVSLVTDPANFIAAPKTEANYSTSVIIKNLGNSWDFEFLPDGRIVITQEKGKVFLYKDKLKTIGSLDVLKDKMSGLMGVAVDPKFSQNHRLYLYYTYNYTKPYQGVREKHVLSRISRFKLRNGSISNEKVLLDSIHGHNFHLGGRLEFGPDKKLYATTGEASSWRKKPYEAQKINSLRGKTLRLNKDGSVPEDNPFNNSYVYSRGHRNPQGLAWHPETKTLYTTEHGSWRHDEINRIEPGANYGWGRFECSEIHAGNVPEVGNAKKPIFCPRTWTVAPSGTTFVDKPEHPWYGDLFVAGLRSKSLHRFQIENGSVKKNTVFYIPTSISGTNRIRDVEFHNGSLWMLGDSDWLVKISPRTR